jgi:hypothetical protein
LVWVLVLVLWVAMRRALAVGVVLAVSLALGGCSLVGSSKSVAPKPTSTIASALDGLQPVVPSKLTAATAKKATVNLANELDSLIASTDIVYVDDHSKLVPATSTAGSYYGVLRTISVSPELDPIQQATAMEKLLVAAGWVERDTASPTSKYLAALSSSSDPSTAWFLLLGGDNSVPKQPVITVQLASPDIPKK